MTLSLPPAHPDEHALSAPPHALSPLPAGDVVLVDGWWAETQQLNHDAVIEHCETWVERMGWTANFDHAASGRPFEHAGIEFTDSEVYKLLEAMAREIERTGDDDLERRYTTLVERVAAAQEPDGYLHTAFGRAWQRPRYSDLAWGHELYCFGHLLQAAAARIRSGRGGLLPEVAARLADHVYAEFGPDGREAVCGHPEIEPALTELWRATGVRRHLELAALFVERRGRGLLGDIEWGRSYFQDDVPVREATVLRGHAVRALYLAAGAVDVAVDTGDDDLLRAVTEQYDRTVTRRTYLTGGVGSHHQDEAFGDDFELPPDRAYAETCAAIASIMVAQRLLATTGDLRYADLVERTLFNAVMCSPRADGRAFFYSNVLHQRTTATAVDEERASARAASGLRAPWFDVSCCPTNLARTLSGLGGLVAAMSDEGLWLLQYATCSVRTRDTAGRAVAVDVFSDYPHDGRVLVRLRSGLPADAAVMLRVPAWVGDGARATLHGVALEQTGGVVAVRGPLPRDTEVLLDLPMTPRLVAADPHVDAVRGQVAVERGPLVLALEDVDLPAGHTVDDVRLLAGEPLGEEGGTVWASLVVAEPAADEAGPSWSYADVSDSSVASGSEQVRVPLVPYHRWGNRGPTTMRVFLPTQ